MVDHRLPKRVMSGELENAGTRGPGGKEKEEWTDCVADDLRLFGVTGDWSTAALDPRAWYNTVCMYVCMYVCMVITYSRVWINRVRLPILLVVS